MATWHNDVQTNARRLQYRTLRQKCSFRYSTVEETQTYVGNESTTVYVQATFYIALNIKVECQGRHMKRYRGTFLENGFAAYLFTCLVTFRLAVESTWASTRRHRELLR